MSNQTKWTRGPWKTQLYRFGNDASGIGRRLVVVRGDHCGNSLLNICMPEAGRGCVGSMADLMEARANAKLIAAAPDLYAACDEALNVLIGCAVPAGGVDDRKAILDAQQMLRAALRKARGEPKGSE